MTTTSHFDDLAETGRCRQTCPDGPAQNRPKVSEPEVEVAQVPACAASAGVAEARTPLKSAKAN